MQGLPPPSVPDVCGAGRGCSYLSGIDGRSRYDVNRTRVSIFRVIPIHWLAAGGKEEDPDPSNYQIFFLTHHGENQKPTRGAVVRPNQKRLGADKRKGPIRKVYRGIRPTALWRWTKAARRDRANVCGSSPRPILRTLLRSPVVECIWERVHRRLRGPRQQARPGILARATAPHVDQQERSAGQARGHQQSQSRRQKEALRIPLPQARQRRRQCTCAVVRAVGVHRELAARAHVAGRAGADEAGEVGVAAAAVGAGARGARVGALAAVAAAEAQRAGAAARAAALQASAAVGAGAAGAVIQVVLAARPREAGAAAAAQGVAQVQAEPACGEGASGAWPGPRVPEPVRAPAPPLCNPARPSLWVPAVSI